MWHRVLCYTPQVCSQTGVSLEFEVCYVSIDSQGNKVYISQDAFNLSALSLTVEQRTYIP